MRLSQGVANLEQAASQVNVGAARFSTWARIMGAPEAILRAAAKDMEPMIRSMVRGNLSRAGIKSRTGKLLRAVNAIQVGINLAKGALVYFYPAGISDYKSKGGNRSSFYEAAASLNYGAVRQPLHTRPIFDTVTGKVNRFAKAGDLGERAKRTIKGKVFNNTASGSLVIRQNRLKKSRIRTVDLTTKNATQSSTVVGKLTVISPRHFLPLSEAQRRVVRDQFLKNVARRWAVKN